MSDQSDDPIDVRWHPTRHYDAGMMALGLGGLTVPPDSNLAIAHFLAGLLAIEMHR